MARIKYIGRKARKADNVADTGLIWAPGEAHEVPTLAAAKLLAHRDVWALEDGESSIPGLNVPVDRAHKLSYPNVVELDSLEGQDPDEPDMMDDNLPNITRMPRHLLTNLAKRRFNQEFPDDKPLDEIRAEIVSLQNSRKRG